MCGPMLPIVTLGFRPRVTSRTRLDFGGTCPADSGQSAPSQYMMAVFIQRQSLFSGFRRCRLKFFGQFFYGDVDKLASRLLVEIAMPVLLARVLTCEPLNYCGPLITISLERRLKFISGFVAWNGESRPDM